MKDDNTPKPNSDSLLGCFGTPGKLHSEALIKRITELETKVKELESDAKVQTAFYNLCIAERNHAWVESANRLDKIKSLESELASANSSIEAYSQKVARDEEMNKAWQKEDADKIEALTKRVASLKEAARYGIQQAKFKGLLYPYYKSLAESWAKVLYGE